MPDAPASISHEERNAIILRRTLGAVSWLYALFNVSLGVLTWAAGPLPRLMAAHGALQGLAGTLLWRPRRGAAAVTLLAAAASIAFGVQDLRVHQVQAALVDGAYAVVAGLLLVKSRCRA